ncbi:hypothetical protein LCGC14_2762880 [marine sediment metagenome]|uniref:M23ase beta-sheet core domain-containing protein n=1 Tax=marine sediment metagenome TaxID=412755 RepID=A0A0F8YYE3_9ZZZZ
MKIAKPYKKAQSRHVTQGFHSNHLAVDLAYKYGSYLVAPENCRIVKIVKAEVISESLADMKRGFGIRLKSVSRNAYHTYWHCLPVFPVRVGDFVLQGKPVAQMGNSGSVMVGGKWLPVEGRLRRGTHLHWDMMIDQIQVDPLKHIDWDIPVRYSMITAIMAVIQNMINLIKGR